MNIPSVKSKPAKATIPSNSNAAQSSTLQLPSTIDPYAQPTPSSTDDNTPLDDTLIQSETFGVPIPPLANLCTTSQPTPQHQSPFIDLLFDPTGHLQFSS
jgi:hypothetical protein